MFQIISEVSKKVAQIQNGEGGRLTFKIFFSILHFLDKGKVFVAELCVLRFLQLSLK